MIRVNQFNPESQPSDPEIVVPIVETLHDPLKTAQIWPEHFHVGGEILKQVTRHAEEARFVQEGLDNLPNPVLSMHEAVESRVVTTRQAERLYATLSDMLDNPEYARLVLYVPFSLVSHVSKRFSDGGLQQTVDRFKTAYMHAWHDLLEVHDIRANFVDGDVLEGRPFAALPLVVKAAHLIPMLIERGLVTESDAEALQRNSRDPVLRTSITQGLMTYRRLGGAASANYEPMHESSSSEITERRRLWLAEVEREAVVMATAEQIAEKLTADVRPDEIAQYEDDALLRHGLIEGIYRAIERTVADQARATVLYDRFSQTLDRCWEQNVGDTRDRLIAAYRRLYRLQVLGSRALAEHGVSLPNLAGPWSENLVLQQEAVEQVKQMSINIAAHPELSARLHPVVLMGGSQLKGYGQSGSDIDLGVFVRPGTAVSEQEHICQQLASLVQNKRYEITDFWLEHDANNQLQVHDFPDPDRHTGDSLALHALFGAVWIGDKRVIQELQNGLLPPYFYDATGRQLYLQKLEQDALQYRLMHKGYARHYPLIARPRASYNSAVDGQSVFWDPGYRRLATELFVRHVFLPKLRK